MSYTNGIGNLQQILSSLATSETRASQQTNSAQGPTGDAASNLSSVTAGKADQASLSATSSAIAQALASPDADDVRADKVAALQHTISAGTYNVSSSDVADKLIQSLLK
jgi:negative regulator of flagellin synthesis FlgM